MLTDLPKLKDFAMRKDSCLHLKIEMHLPKATDFQKDSRMQK